VTRGTLDIAWIHGVPRGAPAADPPIQVHQYDANTYVLRQSKSTSYEAPFIYLLLGPERAMLIDTGATADADTFPLRATVDGLIDEWLLCNPHGRNYELVVAHTHGHGDHVAGDPQFADRAATTTVGKTVEAVQSFFGFTSWPDQVVTYDLGGRVLEITGSPGHHASAITIFDRATGFLLTGDTVYPGRLYVFDAAAFVASLDRLVEFATARPVSHVMGCHIEMTTTPGVDYPLGAKYQPNEPRLQMTVDQLVAVRDAAHAVENRRGIHAYDEFIIVNGMGLRTALRLNARALASRWTRKGD
jgi:hydroxyacylglutathione hydrolase